MTAYAPTMTQLGTSDGSAWTDNDPITITAATLGACRFGPVELGVNEVLTSMVLTLTTVATATPTLTVSGIPDKPELAEWSTSNLPNPQRRIQAVEAYRIASPGGVLTLSLDPGIFISLQRNSDWNGYFSLVFKSTASILIQVDSLAVETTAASWKPSLADTESHQSRPDLCARCGQPVWRENLIRDGYTRTLVCEDCFDPPEIPIPSSRPPRRLIND